MKRRDSMTTPENTLQPSEKLAPFVAPYRDEAPLVSISEVRTLIEQSDQLPNRRRTTIGKITMTLAGLSVIALVLYQMFGGTSQPTKNAQQTRIATQTAKSSDHAILEDRKAAAAALNSIKPTSPVASSKRPSTESKDRPAYAAPGDQIYAELTPHQLARLGILVSDDTILQYNLNHKGEASSTKLTQFSIDGSERATPPAGITVSALSPVLMTQGDGHFAAFHYEDGNRFTWGMTGDEDAHERAARDFLRTVHAPGYHVLGLNHILTRHSPSPGIVERRDTVVVVIGKDVPRFSTTEISAPSALPDSIRTALLTQAAYYAGAAKAPNVQWPSYLTVRADTVTILDLIKKFDEEHNSSNRVRVRTILARLNELVPVIVRTRPGTGKPTSNDYIFWYEPSQELFAALPPAQAALFRKPAAPTHCLTAPNTVSKDATITYCSTAAQEVEAIVQDLAGHIIRIVLVDANAGDNTLVIPTEVLPSGMYIVTIRMKDGSQQSRRIWSENNDPHPLPNGTETSIPADTQAHRTIITFPQNYSAAQVERLVSKQSDPHSFENLNIDSLLSGQTNLTAAAKENLRSSMQRAQKNLRATQDRLSANADYFDSIARLSSSATPLGTPYLELSHQSELQLGVESTDPLVRFYASNGYDTYTGFGVMRTWGVQVLQFSRDQISHPIPNFMPALVTDGIGRKRLSESDIADSAVNSLVPILFRAATQDTLGARDLIFWYQPSAAFLAALPDSIRDIVGGTTHSAVRAQSPRAVRSVRPYPNPSRGEFALDLTMSAPRTLSLVVRNLLGQERARTMLNVPAGASTQHLSFESLEEGIYLLEITSDAGESRFERIVIER